MTLTDPGLTIDEPLDVRPGRSYISAIQVHGWHFFDREVVDAVFGDNAEHPPLGRWLLGLASMAAEPFETLILGPDPVGIYVISGRLATALAFAALVSLITHTAARRYGVGAGMVAGFSLVAMPRVFAHAHLAALDTFVSLFWFVGLIAAERAIRHPRPVTASLGAGVALSLVLLTKIHGWFLLPIVLVWAWARLGIRRGTLAWVAWTSVGCALFVLGWPWLWYDPIGRLSRFWGTGIHRISLEVQYFGHVYHDFDVPWHYPWLYFAATVPLGLHVLGVLGAVKGGCDRRVDPFPLLLLGSIGLFLILFSTRLPVYDGERLFLLIFPLWAILIGRGFATVFREIDARARGRGRRWLRSVVIAGVLSQAYGVVSFHPFGLSYYNLLVGSLPGAEYLGLELTYWGDAVDRVLLDRLAAAASANASAALAPTLYPGQGIISTTRSLFRRDIVLQDEEAATRTDWVVVSRRTAYWKADLSDRLSRRNPIATRSRQGVWLSALWSFDDDADGKIAKKILWCSPVGASDIGLTRPSGLVRAAFALVVRGPDANGFRSQLRRAASRAVHGRTTYRDQFVPRCLQRTDTAQTLNFSTRVLAIHSPIRCRSP